MLNREHRKAPYLAKGRLADVLALIQVLALDESSHRSENGLATELQGPPRSAESWSSLAQLHPEFFRVRPTGENRVSLIIRHVSPRDQGARPPLSPDYTSKLLALAVDLHDREFKRAQAWHIWVPVIATLLGGALALFGVSLRQG